MSGQTGQTFGGGPIIGVEPASPKQSILIYKKMDHYNTWEFTYTPLLDMQQQAGGNAGMGTPASSLTGNGTGANGTGPVGGSSNGALGGSSGSFGGSGSSFGGSGSSFGSSFGSSSPQPQQ
jgi:hypothetical protein